ncbi:MAG: protease modulator HflC [Gammaproteobacteria bacterium]
MKGMRALIVAAVFAVGVFVLLGSLLFVVYPWQSALILQFGKVIGVKKEPGLYVKAPWQDLRMFDSRVLTIDTEDPDLYITAEKENILVDVYIKWRIIDPEKFYTDLRGSEAQAVGRMLEIINRGLRDEIGKRTVKEVVTGDRAGVMAHMQELAGTAAAGIGLEVIDVRLKRVDLPPAVSENVYKNMIEERRRIANERRSTGEAEKETIRAEADRKRAVIIAEAQKKSEQVRGIGDARSAEIFAAAAQQNPEFYDFYRSLAAYNKSMGVSGDILILSPDSDFFKYLKEQGASR